MFYQLWLFSVGASPKCAMDGMTTKFTRGKISNRFCVKWLVKRWTCQNIGLVKQELQKHVKGISGARECGGKYL